MAGIVGIFVTKGCGGHEIHAVGHGIGEYGRVPGVADSEETGEVVVVRQVRFVVVAHGAGAIGVVQSPHVVGGVEEIVHAENVVRGGSSGPCGIAAGQGYVVMAFVPRRAEIFCADGGLVEWTDRDIGGGVVVGQGYGGIEDIDGRSVGDA